MTKPAPPIRLVLGPEIQRLQSYTPPRAPVQAPDAPPAPTAPDSASPPLPAESGDFFGWSPFALGMIAGVVLSYAGMLVGFWITR